MPDYNFTGLSARSFEQLVQAVATKLLGPNTVIFGDGPDGGREATYDGPTGYRAGNESWNGYIVVQAKFRQRPESVARDAAWALGQLSAELKKFTTRKRALRRPQYYIFATNVAFTPVYKKGSKDKAYARLNRVKEKLLLRGLDVWDYDKLRTFLDDADDIRRAYGAWITPGDVLADLVSKLGLRQANFDEILTNFLQKELLGDRFANLEQAGHSVEDRVPLANVFVDLPALNENTSEPPEDAKTETGFVSQVLEAAREKLGPAPLKALGSAASAHGAGPRAGRYVLIGGPGQGKTTVGQFVCQLFRTAILSRKPRRLLSADVSEALAEIQDQCKAETIELPIVRRFPIRIVLSELAAQLNNESESILTYIATRIRRRTNQTFTNDDFRRWLASYPWVLIFDGLDEVPSSSNREELLNAIRDFWIDAAECNADILVVATTRPQGYSEDFSPKFYEHKWLAPLSKTRALHYAQRLVEVRYGGEEDRKEKIISRLGRACRQDATSRLMRSPLQVTIMATLVDRVGQPPQERWNLFKDYYTVIYEREMERDTPPAKILREYQADVNAIHARVGLLLQAESENTGTTDARLPLDRFKKIVAARLTEEGHSGKPLQALQDSIMTAAMHRLVFLVGLEQKQVGFEVRSLQEFMAAEGIMHGPEEDIPARLRKIAPISHWRNVFLFAAGKCFAERQHLRDTVHTICLQLNEDSDPAVQTVLAGSQLAVDLLEDGPARKQPKYSASLLRVGFRLLDLPPTPYQTKLAGLYGPEFEEIFTQEITRRLSQVPRARQMGAWNLLSALSPRAPFAKRIRDAHWPTDNRECIALIRYAGNMRDMLQKLRPLVPRVPPRVVEEAVEYIMPLDPQEVVTRTKSQEWFRAVLLTFSHIRYGYHRPEIALRFSEVRSDQIFRMNFSGFADGQGDWLAPLSQIPAADPSWGLHVSVGRFLTNPSMGELATQLRFLSKLPSTFDPVMIREWWVPWVLSALLDGRRPCDLSQLADKVDDGAVGGLPEWRAAEHRWLTTGVTVADLQQPLPPNLPFGPHIAKGGFPYQEFRRGWFMPHPFDPGLILPQVEALDGSPIQSVLSERILMVVGTASDYYGLDPYDPAPMRRLLTLLRPGCGLSIPALNALFPTSMDTGWAEVLEPIARDASWYSSARRPVQGLATELWKAFMADPRRTGIMRLLSEVSATTQTPDIPIEYLDPSLIDDPRLKAACIILLLTQKAAWSKPKELAAHAAALGSRLTSFTRSAVRVLRERQTDGDFANQFLLSLAAHLAEDQSDAPGIVLDGLDDLVRKRRSQLDDPRVWSELKLPTI